MIKLLLTKKSVHMEIHVFSPTSWFKDVIAFGPYAITSEEKFPGIDFSMLTRSYQIIILLRHILNSDFK